MTKYKGVKTLEVLEGADNYNEWIAARLRPFIKSPAIEIGAGTGNISSYLTGIQKLTLTDVDRELVSHLQGKFGKKQNITCKLLDISKKNVDKSGTYKTVYSVNVLEHIKEDVDALKNMKSLLQPGGNIVLLVPAKKFAYTYLDERLGHYRRYEKDELRSKINKAGLVVEQMNFFNIVGLVSWMVRDRVSRDDMHLNKSHVKIFDAIVPFLRLIEPRNSLPLGISIVAVARNSK